MIDWIISSSVLILVVLAVRALGRNKLSCCARYALWLLVLVRLLVPVQLFEAPWRVSAPAAVDELLEAREVYVLPVSRTPVTSAPYVRSDFSAPPETGPVGSGTGLPIPSPTPQTAEPTVPSRPSADGTELVRYAARVSAADVLRYLWLAGMGAMLLLLLVSNLRFRLRLRHTRTPFAADADGLRVYCAPALPSPCLTGLFRPAIYLTEESTADERRLAHVLAHETTHYRHGDHVWSLLRVLALAVHWYNPLVWLAVRLSKRDSELACDEATLARLGAAQRIPYGETLLALVTVRPRAGDMLSVSTSMTEGKKSIRERIETIVRQPHTAKAALLLAVIVLAVTLIVSFGRQKTAEPDDVPEKLANETMTGRYAAMQDYADEFLAARPTVTYPNGPDSEATANVTDARSSLLKRGELSGLAPEGTLELWNFTYQVRLDRDDVMLVGGMSEEDGWYSIDYWPHSLIALRYPDGTFDVLGDEQGEDFGAYCNSPIEALHDWYVQEKGLDEPLYVRADGNRPMHRFDGDGWYVYLPIAAWYPGQSDTGWSWYSQYDTGSALIITHQDESAEAMYARYLSWDWEAMDGGVPAVRHSSGGSVTIRTAIRLYADPNGGCWHVLTQYDEGWTGGYRADEPQTLAAMAASFTLDERFAASYAANAPVRNLQSLLRSFDPVSAAYAADGDNRESELPVDTLLRSALAQCTQDAAVLPAELADARARAMISGGELRLRNEMQYPGRYLSVRPLETTGEVFLALVGEPKETCAALRSDELWLLCRAAEDGFVQLRSTLSGSRPVRSVFTNDHWNCYLYDISGGALSVLDVNAALGARDSFWLRDGAQQPVREAYLDAVAVYLPTDTSEGSVYRYGNGTLARVGSTAGIWYTGAEARIRAEADALFSTPDSFGKPVTVMVTDAETGRVDTFRWQEGVC